MSAAYLDFLGSVAARRRKAASRQAVGSCVANLQLLEWLLVLRRRTGNTPNLPDVPRKLAKDFIGDAWERLPQHASTMRLIAMEFRCQKKGELNEYVESYLAQMLAQQVLPQARVGELKAELRIDASMVTTVSRFSSTIRDHQSADQLLEQKLRSWGYEITNVMTFEDGDGEIAMILDWS
eukprot:TRINITY_DN11980_c0_g1_i1.p1 TRINITY_DN11980_c0_g1~~TRINITY_DN11980_c0_g1_i1.p1  ORF type:complete len:180 (+),score=46.32 TRINITY_DN11980_c0_g1_i1:38-577(+)